eukprot:Sdes_comp15711_c0_seq1m4747
MPLNSIPPTTTVNHLLEKLTACRPYCYCDVGFWGGVVPGNSQQILPLLSAGVRGFKCFLIESGVPEFPHVELKDLHEAMQQLKRTQGVLLFHAERACNTTLNASSSLASEGALDARKYATYLNTRPGEMELVAIRLVIDLCRQYRVRCHIVHLSTSEALPLIRAAKAEGLPLTVETCHHYLCFSAEQIPEGKTEFKCCPPIRDAANREELWKGLLDKTIDCIVSDHSPAPPPMKLTSSGDFLKAWGGISSVQFGLSACWTECKKRNIPLAQLCTWMCENTAKLCSLDKKKGHIRAGYDADLVIFDENAQFQVQPPLVKHKHKLTPYMSQILSGTVVSTILRGRIVFDQTSSSVCKLPSGSLLLTPL